MNLILLLIIGFLVFLATYMILSLNLIRIIVGISIYTHAGNLIIMSMGHYSDHVTEPLIRGSNTNYVDPLLQALVLTAIVIGFGMTAFLLVLVYRTYRFSYHFFVHYYLYLRRIKIEFRRFYILEQ